MTTYNRPQQLYFCLKSIKRQNIQAMDHEILILDDGNDLNTRDVALNSDAVQGLQVRYIHTGVRTMLKWRCMGFTANIGIQQAKGEIVVLTNSDIYHLGSTIRPVIKSCADDPMALGTIHDAYDDNGFLVKHLEKGVNDVNVLNQLIEQVRTGPRPSGFYPMNPHDPFFLAIRREHLIRVGGYDEDFIGIASEDCDLLDRLKSIGCHYVYAPEGADAVHLYHGRRSIEQLEEDPGFHYNIRLRNERREQLVRNQGRVWGELIDPTAAWSGAPIHLCLWVTSRCNLQCPSCNQGVTRQDNRGYEMDQKELSYFIQSCRQRRIHFSTLELTGGEPTLWPLFESGIAQLQEAKIADRVTFITNGRDAKNVAEVANRYGLYYTVSLFQCTEELKKQHEQYGVGVIWNTAGHRQVPIRPIANSLPADCSQRQDSHGRVVRQLYYLRGVVWYCCMAYAASKIVENHPRYHCPFDEDFDSFFRQRSGEWPICSVCLCNNKVWKVMENPPCDAL